MTSLYDFTVTDLKGAQAPLSAYRGKVALVVNTASKCGLTPQYEGLEALYRELSDKGLVLLGFPCNQFGQQEPGSAEEIEGFCSLNYGVSFPMFEKIDVNGDDTAPLYAWLKAEAPGLLGSKGIKWNFTKFLIDRAGQVVERFAPTTAPESLRGAVEKQL